MNARDHFATLARYNLWATTALFEHVDALPEDEYRRDMGLFFKSVHGSLNHLLVGQHSLWLRRFAEGASPAVVLNEEIEPDRIRLRERLSADAQDWLALVASWPEVRFDGTLDYVTTKGVAQSLPFAATLAHVFNHGTHHRGQITAAVTALGHAGPVLDMVWMLQFESRAAK